MHALPASLPGVLGQAARSIGGSLAAFTAFLSVSTCADYWTTPENATALGILSGASLNFTLQRRAFGATLASCRGGAKATLLRYCIADIIIMGLQQGIFTWSLRAVQSSDTPARGSKAPPSPRAVGSDVPSIGRPSGFVAGGAPDDALDGCAAADVPSGDGTAAASRQTLLALRMASQVTVFLAVSFPLRRHWVFAK